MLLARRTVADLWVEPAVEQINQEIPRGRGAQHQYPGLHNGIVTRGDALQNEPS